jgi:hypothetical protein
MAGPRGGRPGPIWRISWCPDLGPADGQSCGNSGLRQFGTGAKSAAAELGTGIGTGREGTGRYGTDRRALRALQKPSKPGQKRYHLIRARRFDAAFKTGALNHSATHPTRRIDHLAFQSHRTKPELPPPPPSSVTWPRWRLRPPCCLSRIGGPRCWGPRRLPIGTTSTAATLRPRGVRVPQRVEGHLGEVEGDLSFTNGAADEERCRGPDLIGPRRVLPYLNETSAAIQASQQVCAVEDPSRCGRHACGQPPRWARRAPGRQSSHGSRHLHCVC